MGKWFRKGTDGDGHGPRNAVTRNAGERPRAPFQQRISQSLVRLHEEGESAQKWFFAWILAAILLLGLAVAVATEMLDRSPWVAVAATYAVVAAFGALVNRTRNAFIQEDIRRLELQDDIADFDVPVKEAWALKLLGVQEDRLRRYYEINMSQSIWSFVLGIVALAGGFVIVGFTLHYIQTAQNPEKIAGAVLGGVTTLTAQAVAAIYLRMNVSATASLQTLHGRLVDTYHLFIANMLATRVGAADQSRTWADLALTIAKLPATPPGSVPDTTAGVGTGGTSTGNGTGQATGGGDGAAGGGLGKPTPPEKPTIHIPRPGAPKAPAKPSLPIPRLVP